MAIIGITGNTNYTRNTGMKEKPRVYGVATVGSEGQIVIPQEARQEHRIETGDKIFIISGPPGSKNIISLVTEEGMSELLQFVEDHALMLKNVVGQIPLKRKKKS